MRGRLLRNGIWHVVPVLVAGLGHVAALKLNLLAGLAVPIDRNATWRGKPVFGANKTWRGVLLMGALGFLATGFQWRAGRRFAPSWVPSDCDHVNPWLLGVTTGVAYCAAELPNSFVKRRLGVPPGSSGPRLAGLQYVADGADSVIGCVLALHLMCRLRWRDMAAIVALGLAVHIAVERLMWLLGLKGNDGHS